MNHVQDAAAFALDAHFAGEELFQQIAATRAVDSRRAQNDGRKILCARSSEENLFGLHQDLCGFTSGFSRAGFVHKRAIVLAVNARAAGVEKSCCGTTSEAWRQPCD